MCRRFIYLPFLALLLFASSGLGDGFVRTQHLFSIERSKNGNLVRYDVRLMANSDLAESDPVVAYWLLENGEKKPLNSVERRFAYGVSSQEKLDKNRYRISVAAMKDREIIVVRLNGSYKAFTSVDGQESILERIYVEAEERTFGLPKVLYIDIFGRRPGTNRSVSERVVPD